MRDFRNMKQELAAILDRDGTRAAVVFLNSLTEHRFTVLYRFDDETLRSVCFYDSENPGMASTPDIPVMASYCVFVRDGGDTFAVSDSQHDMRVREHPKRKKIQSYCGVPLLDEDGRMFGTICHFDFRALPISDANVALMEAMAPLIQRRAAAS